MLEPAVEPAAPDQDHVRSAGRAASRADEIDADDLRLRGDAAPGLRGSYVCVGGDRSGGAMLHAVTFDRGRVRYRNRRIPSKPAHAVIRHAGRTLALGAAGLPVELTDAFGVAGEWDGNGRIPDMAPHPKLDPVWDELVWFGQAPDAPHLVWGAVDARGRVHRPTPVEVSEPLLMHDFAVTAEHVVFVDGPRVGVLPRDPELGSGRWFHVEPRTVGHVCNAFTEGERVTVDYVCAAPGDIGTARGGPLWRTVVDLAVGSVSDEVLDDRIVELPRVDARRVGVPYRFAFAAMRSDPSAQPGFDALVRWDFRTDAVAEYRPGVGVQVGEPQVVARPGGAGDEAWVLSMTASERSEVSELVVLDAADLASGPVASVALPHRVPPGEHATWFGA